MSRKFEVGERVRVSTVSLSGYGVVQAVQKYFSDPVTQYLVKMDYGEEYLFASHELSRVRLGSSSTQAKA